MCAIHGAARNFSSKSITHPNIHTYTLSYIRTYKHTCILICAHTSIHTYKHETRLWAKRKKEAKTERGSPIALSYSHNSITYKRLLKTLIKCTDTLPKAETINKRQDFDYPSLPAKSCVEPMSHVSVCCHRWCTAHFDSFKNPSWNHLTYSSHRIYILKTLSGLLLETLR